MSFTCSRCICRAQLVSRAGGTSAAGPRKYLWELSLSGGEGQDHRFCAQGRQIFEKKSLKICFGLSSKVAPLLGPVLMPDPRVAGPSRVYTRASIEGLWERGVAQNPVFFFFLFVCLGCLPGYLWVVLCSLLVRYLNFQGRDLRCEEKPWHGQGL